MQTQPLKGPPVVAAVHEPHQRCRQPIRQAICALHDRNACEMVAHGGGGAWHRASNAHLWHASEPQMADRSGDRVPSHDGNVCQLVPEVLLQSARLGSCLSVKFPSALTVRRVPHGRQAGRLLEPSQRRGGGAAVPGQRGAVAGLRVQVRAARAPVRRHLVQQGAGGGTAVPGRCGAGAPPA